MIKIIEDEIVQSVYHVIDNQREAIDTFKQYLEGSLTLNQTALAIDFLEMNHLFDLDLSGNLVQKIFPVIEDN